MADRDRLPAATVRAVAALVRSLEELDVLVTLVREPRRSWTGAEMADRLRASLDEVIPELERMVELGVAARDPGEPARFRFEPADAERAAQAAELAAAYGARRIELVNHVASHALDRVLRAAGASRARRPS